MAFFDNLSAKAKEYAEVAAGKTKEFAGVAAEKAKEAKEAAKLSAAIAGEQRELDKSFKAIGEWYVSQAEGEVPEAIADVVAAAKASVAKLEELKAQRVKEEEEVPEEEKEHTCPLCGGVSTGKFCPFCGAPMGE